MPEPVYHLELRSFPTVARAFNLDRETLDLTFLKPWVAGELIDYEDKRWAPDKTKIKVIEGTFVEGIGIGRGWGEATRHGRDVTDAVVAEIHRGADARPDVDALKAAIAEVAAEPVAFADVMALAAAGHPQWKASEQLSLAEQAVWEMLHRQQLEMLAAGEPVAADRWQEIVLNWLSWVPAADGDAPLWLRALR
jgi:hypothetical protein